MPDPLTDVTSSSKRFAAKREALLAAASELFNAKGVMGTTLADVAASVGLVKNSVTYYYKRKEDLAVACFEQSIAVLDGLIATAAQQPTVRARAERVIREQVAHEAEVIAGRRPQAVMFVDMRALPDPLGPDVLRQYLDMFRRLRELLRGQETLHWSRETLNARAQMLLSCLHAVRIMVKRYEPEDLPRVAERIGSILLNGIQASESDWTSAGVESEWLQQVPERTPAAQFLRAATELINEQGYAGASVNRIAERLNLTKGAFYYYNENKDDLVAQCFDRSVMTIRKAVNLTEAYSGSAWDHLCSIVRGLVRFQLSHEGPLLRSTANTALPDPARRAHVSEEFGRVRERLAGIVVTGLIDRSLRPVDPALCADVLLVGIFAAAELKLFVHSADASNVSDLFARPILMGLLSEPQAQSPAPRPHALGVDGHNAPH
jgi:AcrR family transcriptional regulator